MTGNKLNLYIEINISKLSLEWFHHKEQQFKKELGYNSKENYIRKVHKDASYPSHEVFSSGDGKFIRIEEEMVPIEDEYKFSLQEYCSCYLPLNELTGWGASPAENYSSRFKSYSYGTKAVASDLVDEAGSLLSPKSSVSESIQFVLTVKDLVNKEVEQLKDKSTHTVYRSVLDDFLQYVNQYLTRKFEKEFIANEVSVQPEDKLEFTIGQESLASLLLILRKAGIIQVEDTPEGENKFFEFCQRYFHFTLKKKTKRPETVKTFRDKYNKANKNYNSKSSAYKPLHEIIDMLSDFIEDFKKRRG
ncbi:MAG TPA: hypothetical protein VNS32_04440 [Flavisolibacter sp.]|nr:hypothetical protein [Flavisolibacter sp.]